MADSRGFLQSWNNTSNGACSDTRDRRLEIKIGPSYCVHRRRWRLTSPASNLAGNELDLEQGSGLGMGNDYACRVRSMARKGEEHSRGEGETISKFLMVMKEIEEMVVKMVFESYGVEKYLDSYLKANEPSIRLSHYGAPKSHQVIDVMGSHTDPTMTTIVCQHEQEGLEIQSKDGSWTTPSQYSVNFLLGDYFLAWSNGRQQPSCHRLKMTGYEDRYSTVYSSLPNNETQVQTPKELVDEKHPLLFNPFNHKDYFEFRITGPGKNVAHPVEAFCGTGAVIDKEPKA